MVRGTRATPRGVGSRTKVWGGRGHIGLKHVVHHVLPTPKPSITAVNHSLDFRSGYYSSCQTV